jgi:hypothetical protein
MNGMARYGESKRSRSKICLRRKKVRGRKRDEGGREKHTDKNVEL